MKERSISITADGKPQTKWLSVHVEAGATDAARSATITFAEPNTSQGSSFSQDWAFKPGAKVEISAGGLLFSGYVDDYNPSFDSQTHIANVTCRSKSKDAIDSSAIHKTGEFKKKDMKEIGQELLQEFGGLSIDSNVQLDKIDVHRLSPGSTVFNELENLARQQGVLIVGEADGSMLITKAGKSGRHSGALVQGRAPVVKGSASLSEKQRHSKVHARGQKRRGSGKGSLRLEHIAEDKSIGRHRPLLIIPEGDTDKDRLKTRATNQVARAAGWSTTAEITVNTWRDDGGNLWDPKKLVYCKSPFLKVDQDMAIKNVKFSATNQGGSGDGGTTAVLSLVDPQALGGDSVKGKSNDAWNTDVQDGGEGDSGQ